MAFDVIVIGLGAVGSAAAYQLARRGARVLGIDRFHPPHDRGSSHGHTRVTRCAVGEGAEYVPLVRRSHQIWQQLQAELDAELMLTTGVLVIGPGLSGDAQADRDSFVSHTLAVAQQFGIEHQALDAQGVRERYPQFLLRGDERACLEPGGGVLRPERCVAAQLTLARRHGAVLQMDESVLALRAQGSGVAVRTGRAVHHAARAVLCAGAWTPSLAANGWPQRLRVMRQTLHWLRPESAVAFAPDRFPAFIWSSGFTAAESFYGLPMVDGLAGLKVGTQQCETEVAPDQLQRSVTPDETLSVYQQFVRGRLQGLTADRVHAIACPYTVAPGSRFMVAAHPEVPAALVASACSGHGFKHSAALGEALAELTLQGRSAIDLSCFAPTP